MTYLRRAIKYFFYYCILLSVILTVLVLLDMVEADVQAMFRGGWSSVGQVLGLFAVVAAIYPRFGFTTREALVPAGADAAPAQEAALRGRLLETMQNRGYRLENEGDAFEVGMEEYFDRGGVSIVEWADMVIEVLPEDAKYIFMEYGGEEGERIYKCIF